MSELANIGEAAELSGISAKMIRHYEEVGLLYAPKRTMAGYRIYSEQDIHILRFIRQARNLGFSIKQIGNLLNLWRDQSRPSNKVREIAVTHIVELDKKIVEMSQMKSELERLVDCCQGDQRPECPILENLADVSVHKNPSTPI